MKDTNAELDIPKYEQRLKNSAEKALKHMVTEDVIRQSAIPILIIPNARGDDFFCS